MKTQAGLLGLLNIRIILSFGRLPSNAGGGGQTYVPWYFYQQTISVISQREHNSKLHFLRIS